MTDLVVRPFAWSDVPAITAIYRHAVEHTVATFDTSPPGERAMAEKFGLMVEQGHPVLIAERAGAVVAYSYASTYRPRPAYRFTCEDSVYVHPDHQGQGIGSLLLGRLVEAARDFGFKQMIAVITAERENSIRLHEKHGFSHIGRHPRIGFKFDRWLDIVHMQRAL
ncbi:MAG TPA: N-acetyltransferase [Alphaproteobacteria bacterium]|nr:N-acetyltransferase [Alphaproteobacteria bacterium]